MNFVSDRTRSGNHIRVLTVIDEATRECLALEVDSSITGKRGSSVLNLIPLLRSFPQEILTDNGSEFTGNALNAWSYDHHVEHVLLTRAIQPRTANIESLLRSCVMNA